MAVKRRDKRPKQDLYTWNCEYCGKSFETESYNQRYCKRTHREYAYRERKLQKAQVVDGMSVNKNSL